MKFWCRSSSSSSRGEAVDPEMAESRSVMGGPAGIVMGGTIVMKGGWYFYYEKEGSRRRCRM